MKRILFYLTLFVALGGNLNAQQIVFTGLGDGRSWDDRYNWTNDELPQYGDDILISGIDNVYYYDNGNSEYYGSLELQNARLTIGGDLHLMGGLLIDEFSTLSMEVYYNGSYTRLVFDFDDEFPPIISFNGTLDVNFYGLEFGIDDEFEFFQGNPGELCATPQTIITSDNSSTGFQVTLESQCDEDSYYVTYKIESINYTTAIQWDGEAGDGLWDSPTNWEPDGVPLPSSPLIFNVPGGSYAKTNNAGTTTAHNIKIGRNNTLEINGDLSMESSIYNYPEGTIVWNAGELSKSSTIQSLLINYGTINMDGSGLKKIDNNVEIWSFKGVINHNQGNLEVNNGKIKLFNDTEYKLGDEASIGYSSGTLHDFEIGYNATVKKENIIVLTKNNLGASKENNSGTSIINLTNFVNNGKVICETGTLNIIGGLTTGVGFFNGSYRGNGTIGFPTSHIMQGDIYPGSSPGVLTVLQDLTTGTDADFIIEINGSNPGTEYDQINVIGEAILEGNIDIQLGYMPANDASFEILSAGTLTSCNFPSQITKSFGGMPYTFNVVCFNNSLFLNGPGVTLSTNENILEEELALYPNPASSFLNVKSSLLSKGHWELINQLGQVVKGSAFESKALSINVKEIPTGVYFFKIEDENLKATTTKRIVISN